MKNTDGRKIEEMMIGAGLTMEQLVAKVQTEHKTKFTYRQLDVMIRDNAYPRGAEKILEALSKVFNCSVEELLLKTEAA